MAWPSEGALRSGGRCYLGQLHERVVEADDADLSAQVSVDLSAFSPLARLTDDADEPLGRPLALAYSVRRGDGRAHHRVHPLDHLHRAMPP